MLVDEQGAHSVEQLLLGDEDDVVDDVADGGDVGGVGYARGEDLLRVCMPPTLRNSGSWAWPS